MFFKGLFVSGHAFVYVNMRADLSLSGRVCITFAGLPHFVCVRACVCVCARTCVR